MSWICQSYCYWDNPNHFAAAFGPPAAACLVPAWFLLPRAPPSRCILTSAMEFLCAVSHHGTRWAAGEVDPQATMLALLPSCKIWAPSPLCGSEREEEEERREETEKENSKESRKARAYVFLQVYLALKKTQQFFVTGVEQFENERRPLLP